MPLGIVAALIALYGPTPEQTMNRVGKAVNWLGRVSDWMQANLIPHTAMQWGLLALMASFAFLAAGASISMRKPMPPLGEATPADGPAAM